jgi:tripartite-type tricarboxylate transporter receptor subunit TctC
MFRSHNRLFKLSLLGIFLVTALFAKQGLPAEIYPDKPIALVNGWQAGGMHDNLSRLLSRAAEKELGQPIINENKTGGAGVIAKSFVLKSKPDGYTLGTTITATYIVQPQIRKTPYNPFTDITDIMTFAKYNNGLCVRTDSPWNTIEDVLAYSKKNPGKFTYAHPGVGMMPHIVLEQYTMKEGVKWTGVPFKGGPEGVSAALGGHTDSVVMGTGDLIPQIKAGKLKLLLIISGTRWPEVPNVPTILEKGHDLYVLSYMGIYGPKGLPEPVRQKVETVFKNATKDPAYQDMLKQYYIEGAFLPGKEYSEKWKAMYAPMGKILNTLGLVEK